MHQHFSANKTDRLYPVNVYVIAVQRYVEYYVFSKVLAHFREFALIPSSCN
jgi:hypothetical protein